MPRHEDVRIPVTPRDSLLRQFPAPVKKKPKRTFTMAQLETGLKNDPTFLELIETDPDKASSYASEVLKSGSDFRPPEGVFRRFGRPIVETAFGLGGSLIGGAAGLPFAPVTAGTSSLAGAMVGGALGFAAGSSLSDNIEQLFGEQEQLQSIEDALIRTKQNIERGLTIELFGRGIQLGGRVVGKAAAPFLETMGEEGKRIKGIADKLGIPLNAQEITGSPTLQIIQDVLAKFPISADRIKKGNLLKLQKLIKERDRLLSERGSTKSLEEIGFDIQNEATRITENVGIVRDKAKKGFRNALLEKLGSKESYEQLGRKGQEATEAFIKRRQVEAGTVFTKASEEASNRGKRVTPTSMNRVAKELEEVLLQAFEANPSAIDAELRGMFKLFRSSGNKKLDEALSALAERRPKGGSPQIQAAFDTMEEQIKAQLGQPGFTLQSLNLIRNKVSSLIDKTSPEKKFGIVSAGSGTDAFTSKQYIKLKAALDADIKAFGEETGGNIQALLELGRFISGSGKSLANDKAVQKYIQANAEDAANVLLKNASHEKIRELQRVLGPTNFKSIQQGLTNAILRTDQTEKLTGDVLRSKVNQYGHEAIETVLGKGSVKKFTELADFFDGKQGVPDANQFLANIIRSQPDRVARLIVQPGPADSIANLLIVEKEFGSWAVEAIRKGIITDILTKASRDQGKTFLPKTFVTELEKYGPKTLKKLFENDPKGLKELQDLQKISSRLFEAQANSEPSQRAVSMIGRIAMMTVVTVPSRGMALVLKVSGLGKLLNSEVGRKWLTEGLNIAPGSSEAAGHFAKLIPIMETSDLPKQTPLESRPSFDLDFESLMRQSLDETSIATRTAKFGGIRQAPSIGRGSRVPALAGR